MEVSLEPGCISGSPHWSGDTGELLLINVAEPHDFRTTFLASFLTHWISEAQNQGLVESDRMDRKSEGLGILGWSDSFETRAGRTHGGQELLSSVKFRCG